MTNGQRVETLKLFVDGYMAWEIADELKAPLKDVRATISRACGADDSIYACHKYPQTKTSQYTCTEDQLERVVRTLWG